MNSIHFQRWTEQLKSSGHEIHWFNVRDGGFSEKLSWVNQIVGWKQKFSNLKGRSFLKKNYTVEHNIYQDNEGVTYNRLIPRLNNLNDDI